MDVRKSFERARRNVYWAIASVANQVRTRTGVVGKTVGKLETAAKDAEKLLESVSKRSELDEKYNGIGARIGTNLTAEDYERCLRFYESARNSIPEDEEFRESILEDIRASASSNPQDLLHFYRTIYYPWNVVFADTILCKSDVVDRYFAMKK